MQQVIEKKNGENGAAAQQIARTLDHHPIDPLLIIGYPLYLTVPVTN